jgi:hypothetical protein
MTTTKKTPVSSDEIFAALPAALAAAQLNSTLLARGTGVLNLRDACSDPSDLTAVLAAVIADRAEVNAADLRRVRRIKKPAKNRARIMAELDSKRDADAAALTVDADLAR